MNTAELIVKKTIIKLQQGDITLQQSDAIVNAANSGCWVAVV
jgi:O-acetyl-ADP-ribose deacetylase (regulator of RNase III)